MRRIQILACFVFLLVVVPVVTTLNAETSISGQLSLIDIGMNCDGVRVGLEQTYGSESRHTDTDLLCGFIFSDLAPGIYYLHVAVPGYEEVRQPVRVMDPHATFRTIIVLNRIADYSPPSDEYTSTPPDNFVLDVSEILDQYPKEAVQLYEESVESRQKGRSEQAARELEMALDLAPNFYAAHNDLGIVYDSLGRFEDAAIHLWKAHDINAAEADPLINLSALLLETGELGEAERVANLAVETNPLSARGFFNLGMAQYRRSENERAEKAFITALHLAPTLLETRLALANVYGKLGRLDSLLEQLDFYLEKAPEGTQRSEAEQSREKVVNIIKQQSG